MDGLFQYSSRRLLRLLLDRAFLVLLTGVRLVYGIGFNSDHPAMVLLSDGFINRGFIKWRLLYMLLLDNRQVYSMNGLYEQTVVSYAGLL